MKIYRRPLLSPLVIFQIILCAIIVILGLWAIGNNQLQLIILAAFIALCISLISLCACYIIITDDRLIFRNAIYLFWSKSFLYESIIKVKFVFIGGKYNSYMQVVTAKGRSGRILIELVKKSDYNTIIADLQERGVKIETKGLDAILKRNEESSAKVEKPTGSSKC